MSAPDRNRHHADLALDAGAPSTHDPATEVRETDDCSATNGKLRERQTDATVAHCWHIHRDFSNGLSITAAQVPLVRDAGSLQSAKRRNLNVLTNCGGEE
jgi:hypothetical protein